MEKWIFQYWLEAALGLICTLLGAGFAYLKGKVRRYAAVEKGVMALLFDRILQAYLCHAKRGYISVEELRNVEHLFTAYSALGGNGTGTELYERLKDLPHSRPRRPKAQTSKVG